MIPGESQTWSVREVFNLITGWGLVGAVLLSCQFHLLLFQAGSWGLMILDYTEDTGSVKQGMEMTFDGKNPCSGCRAVAAMQQIQNDGEPQAADLSRGKILVLMPLIPYINSSDGLNYPKAYLRRISEGLWDPVEIILDTETPPPRV